MLKIFNGMKITLANLSVQIFTFVAANQIASVLGVKLFGVFGVVQADFGVFGSLAEFGLTPILIAFVGKKEFNSALFRRLLGLKIQLSFLVFLLYLCFIFLARFNHDSFWVELILSPALIFSFSVLDWYFIAKALWIRLFVTKLLFGLSYVGGIFVLSHYNLLQNLNAVAAIFCGAGMISFSSAVLPFLHKELFQFAPRIFWKKMLGNSFALALVGPLTFFMFPIGIYLMDIFSPGNEFLGAYQALNRIIWILSTFIIHFVHAHLVGESKKNISTEIQIKDWLIESFHYSTLLLIPVVFIWSFPEFILEHFFYGIAWNPKMLEFGVSNLRWLSFALVLQGFRINLVSFFINRNRTWIYFLMVLGAGFVNIIIGGGLAYLDWTRIGLYSLVGDVFLNSMLFILFVRHMHSLADDYAK